MEQRLQDRLIGAAIAVLVLVLGLVLAGWSISDPAPDRPGQAVDRPATGPRARATPPSDLAADEIWVADVVLDAGTVATPDAVLRDVHAVGRDVRTGPEGIAVGVLAVDATVPFDVVADQLGEGIVVRRGLGGKATVVRVVEFAGREFRVVMTGTVEAVDGEVVVVPATISIGGPSFLSQALGAVARELVRIEHTIEGLPEGLVLEDVTVAADGFRASLAGEDVDLVP